MILKDYYKEINDTTLKTKRLDFNKMFVYWRSILYGKCINLFVYKNLPTDLPQREIEFRLITNGFCGFHEAKKGGYIVTYGSMSGVTQYADMFKLYTYATPKESGMRFIDRDCVIIDNNSIRNPLKYLIDRYACLLAHADLSLQAIMINSRATGILSADTQQTADNIKEWYEGLVDGKIMAIVDDMSMNSLINSQGLRNVSTQYPSSTSIKDFYDIHHNLLKDFFNDIGVKLNTEKRERLIDSEVAVDNQMLLYNVNDMLNCRKEAIEKINKMFGLNITVELNPIYELLNVASTQQKEVDNESIGNVEHDTDNI